MMKGVQGTGKLGQIMILQINSFVTKPARVMQRMRTIRKLPTIEQAYLGEADSETIAHAMPPVDSSSKSVSKSNHRRRLRMPPPANPRKQCATHPGSTRGVLAAPWLRSPPLRCEPRSSLAPAGGQLSYVSCLALLLTSSSSFAPPPCRLLATRAMPSSLRRALVVSRRRRGAASAIALAPSPPCGLG